MKLSVAMVLLLAACSPKSNSSPPPASDDGGGAAADGGDAAAEGGTPAAGTCHPTGCSGIICAAEDQVSTCEYRPEYACYKTAECKQQDDGSCGWTKTAELDACLASPPAE